MNDKRLFRVIELNLLLLPACMLLLTTSGFAIKITITPWHFWLALLLCSVITFFISKRMLTLPITSILFSLFSSLIILACCIAFSAFFLGLSFDGMNYHQPTLISFAQGWNPFYDWHGQLITQKISKHHHHSVPINFNFFGYASELIGAIIYKGVQIYEASKCYNYIYIIIAALISFRFFNKFKRLNKTTVILITATIVFNPVVGYQGATFYVDGQLASLLTIFLLLLMDNVIFADKLSLFEASAVLIPLANVKFTGLIYALIFTAIFFCYLLFFNRKQLQSYCFFLSSAFLISGLLVGFNPFVTNLLSGYNPLYPVIQFHHLHTNLAAGMGPEFIKQNRWMQLILSLFHVQYTHAWNTPHQFIIFPRIYDARYAGFGFIFGYIFIASLLLLFFQKHKGLLFAIIALIISMAINTNIWWARIVPQTWLLPILIIAGVLVQQHKKWLSILSSTFLIFLFLNAVGIFTYGIIYYGGKTIKARRLLHDIDHQFGSVSITRIKANLAEMQMLKSAGIKVYITRKSFCKHPVKIPYFINDYCR